MSAGRKNYDPTSQHWCTPRKYVNAVREFFDGKISLDPCSNQYSIVDALNELRLPDQNGLIECWGYSTIYVNPPYGRDRERGTSIKDWLRKCAHANADYGSEVLALVPVAPNTSHWKEFVFGMATAICFLYDTRLRFLVNGFNPGKGAPMACAMIYWGSEYDKFQNIFLQFGAVVPINHLKGSMIGVGKHSTGTLDFIE